MESLQIIGRYRLLSVLGQGGMGIVYRASHVETGEAVALKTIRMARAGHLASIRREIHALARLRHPGIVRIVDEGVADGIPWYAMELLHGPTLRRQLAEECALGTSNVRTPMLDTADDPSGTWTERLIAPSSGSAWDISTASLAGADAGPKDPRLPAVATWRANLKLLHALCPSLAYLHGEGIVHRDLKPDNVLIRDGRPVLMDFGLAARFAGAISRDQLDVDAALVGTVAYMSPEQGRGEAVDSRSDLYALGCMLYEVLTGRPPFIAGSVQDVLAKHQWEEPVPLARLRDDVPEEVDALVEQLLLKRPSERVGYVEDVARALERAGIAEPSVADDVRRPPLFRPGFVGRRDDLHALRAALPREPRGSVVLVTGEMGIGKTRFVAELGREAQRAGTRVLAGECLPAVAGPGTPGAARNRPLQPFRAILQSIGDLCRERGTDETERLLGRRLSLLALYAPTLLELPGPTQPAPEELPPEQARLRLFRYLSETLVALDPDDPCLVILDDIHHADDLTLGFLSYLLRTRDRTPLLLVATYRPEEATPELAALAASDGATSFSLRRLDGVSVSEMARDMLGGPPPPRLVSDLADNSEGNPLFLAEYVRAAVDDGVLLRQAGGQWSLAPPPAGGVPSTTLPLPRSIRGLVTRRLDGLPVPARHLASAAAVLGLEIDLRVLTAMSDLDEDELLSATAELLVRQVFEERTPPLLRFSYGRLRDVAYEEMAPPERTRWHGRAAEAILRVHGSAPLELMAELGEHWQLAAHPERAWPCYLAAARDATRRYGYHEAERLYRAHLALVPRPSAEATAGHNELGEQVLGGSGRHAEAVVEHRAALADATRRDDSAAQAESLRGLAAALHRSGHPEEARIHYDHAIRLARSIGDRRGEGVALLRLGVLAQDQGRFDSSHDLYEQARDIGAGLNDGRLEGAASSNLATLATEQGRVDEALELYERALHVATGDDNRRLEALTLSNLATLHHDRGDRERALDLYQRALAVHRDTGNRGSEALVLGNIGICHHQAGEHEEARALYGQALAIAHEIGDRRSEAATLVQISTLDRDDGALGAAEESARTALELHRRSKDRRSEATTQVLLASILRLGGRDLAQAERLVARSRTMLDEMGDRHELAKCLCELGQVLLARGGDARTALADARAIRDELRLGGDSELGELVARLERDCAAAT